MQITNGIFFRLQPEIQRWESTWTTHLRRSSLHSNHCSAKNVDQEFFKRVRAAYYVVSGNDPGSGEPSRAVLDALLEAKAQWGTNLQVLFDFTLNEIYGCVCMFVVVIHKTGAFKLVSRDTRGY